MTETEWKAMRIKDPTQLPADRVWSLAMAGIAAGLFPTKEKPVLSRAIRWACRELVSIRGGIEEPLGSFKARPTASARIRTIDEVRVYELGGSGFASEGASGVVTVLDEKRVQDP